MSSANTISQSIRTGKFLLAAAILAFTATSCHEQDETTAFMSGKNMSKPVVTLVPVINSTTAQPGWDLSDELSSAIYSQLAETDNFCLVNPGKVRAMTKKLRDDQNPFGTNISWVKNAFAGDEFVVFLELIEHEEVPRQDRKDPSPTDSCSADLKLSMRVRVIDMREGEPQVVLQEIVHDSHYIPRPFNQSNFYQQVWGDDFFSISPMGLAHMQFTQQIASRVEDYIRLSAIK